MPPIPVLLVAAVFVAALALAVVRPWAVAEAWWTAAGAVLMLALGAVGPRGAWLALWQQANVFLFLLGLMCIAGLADAAGFFDAAGALAAGLARGSGRRLLVATFGVGALLTAFLSNDATALILTPVVYAIATRLRLRPLPYLLAATFVADTASLLLPVSNPINVLVGGRLHWALGTYLAHLLPAAVLVVLLNAAIFLAVFWRETGTRYEVDWRQLLAEAAPDRWHLFLTAAALVAIAIAYLVASAAGAPIGAVGCGGALLLALVATGRRRLDVRRVREHVSLSVLLYVAGLFVMVAALERAGVTTELTRLLGRFVESGPEAIGAGTIAAAVGSNLANNVPASTFLLSGSAALPPAAQAPFLAGVLLGADLGPNLTPVGSLSTMLWLVAVRRRGVTVRAGDYLRLGAVTVPILLLASWALVAATYRA
ncbi:MAG: SLC13 family permease [Candidatus Dormiibacterota bacterium]